MTNNKLDFPGPKNEITEFHDFPGFNDLDKSYVIDRNLVNSVPIVVPAGILELGSSLSFSGHSSTSLLGNLMKEHTMTFQHKTPINWWQSKVFVHWIFGGICPPSSE